MKIVADNKIPYLNDVFEATGHEMLYLPASDITSEVVRDAKVLLTRTRTRCDRALLEGSDVEFIGTATIGTDHIDLDYCRDHGITVANAPGCNAPAVAQWVHCAIIEWLKANNITGPITLGIVGVGHVGSIVARWARQLGYRVLLNDPPLAERSNTLTSPFSPLTSLQRECDIITFHTPLTSDGDYPTWHLCDEDFLNSLERCRLIINAARGAVCDNHALLYWDGDIALDCWENEPNINFELLDKAFVATQHIAGYSKQGKLRGTAMIISALNSHYGWHLPVPQADRSVAGASYVTPELIANSYDIIAETLVLKSKPHFFETLRNIYPLRSEI